MTNECFHVLLLLKYAGDSWLYLIKNFKKVKESLFLILVAVAVGLIVSAVAQLFMIAAKDIFAFIFQNKNFVLSINIGTYSLNLIPMLI